MNKVGQRRIILLLRYNQFSTPKEREEWFRSLRPEDRNLIRKDIAKAPNALF